MLRIFLLNRVLPSRASILVDRVSAASSLPKSIVVFAESRSGNFLTYNRFIENSRLFVIDNIVIFLTEYYAQEYYSVSLNYSLYEMHNEY